MFVRFQWRNKSKRRAKGRLLLADGYVQLVESFWTDDKKPRQRHVAYLGPFLLKQDAFYRCWWWHRMRDRLDALGDKLPERERPKIEASLAALIPPVTPGEVTAHDLAYQRVMRRQFGESAVCYLAWPDNQPGVPPRPGDAVEKTREAVAS